MKKGIDKRSNTKIVDSSGNTFIIKYFGRFLIISVSLIKWSFLKKNVTSNYCSLNGKVGCHRLEYIRRER